jgi:methylmalonyl-CoA/ethylmalonyl-CoA epimerase
MDTDLSRLSQNGFSLLILLLGQEQYSLHHIAFQVEGMLENTAYLDAKGLPLLQRGEYTGGRYAYFDGSTQLGAILELLEND